jgi:tetratricopeptide (TPR) repeat protein
LNKNFVLFRAINQETAGAAIFKQFGVRGTPTTMVFDGAGAEVDWILGYGPPAENFQTRLQKIIDGTDTFKAISAAYAKDPKDAATVFKLARKYSDRLDSEKANAKYKEVIALDPEGKAGTYTQEYSGITAPYSVFAEYYMATANVYGPKADIAPAKAFIAKYPESKLTKPVYERISNYFENQATKEEAAAFFAEYTSKFPQDPSAINAWLSRIINDKGPYDKGKELAAQLKNLTDFNPEPGLNQNIAQLYWDLGEKDKAEETFGKAFMAGKVENLAYNLLAYANFWMQNKTNQDSALAMIETALKLEPGNSYFLSQAASAYIKAGKEAKALELYGPTFAKKNEKDASALNSYAGFWTRQGKNLDDALAAAKKAVDKMPDTYYMWSTLSQVFEKMKNYPEAIKAKEKSIALAPDQVKETFKKDLERLNKAAAEKK